MVYNSPQEAVEMKGRDLGWVFLFFGGLAEIVWAMALKASDGFSDLQYGIICAIFLAISLYFLARALSCGIPMGTAYAVWVGIGAIGAVIFGIILYDDPVTPLRMLFIALVIGCIIGLQMTCPKPEECETKPEK